MMKTSVLSLGVCLGLSLLCNVSNAQNIRDPISRKFQPQYGFFESKSTSVKQTGVLKSNPTHVHGPSRAIVTPHSKNRPSFLKRLWK
ncbi:MAG: hypothetical protein MUC43_02490 [Pirellula sp.]|jgi:hypothetical protein|nr:hypothetical protein [Pirellula sp.]